MTNGEICGAPGSKAWAVIALVSSLLCKKTISMGLERRLAVTIQKFLPTLRTADKARGGSDWWAERLRAFKNACRRGFTGAAPRANFLGILLVAGAACAAPFTAGICQVRSVQTKADEYYTKTNNDYIFHDFLSKDYGIRLSFPHSVTGCMQLYEYNIYAANGVTLLLNDPISECERKTKWLIYDRSNSAYPDSSYHLSDQGIHRRQIDIHAYGNIKSFKTTAEFRTADCIDDPDWASHGAFTPSKSLWIGGKPTLGCWINGKDGHVAVRLYLLAWKTPHYEQIAPSDWQWPFLMYHVLLYTDPEHLDQDMKTFTAIVKGIKIWPPVVMTNQLHHE